jgi:hypothetical protein
LYENFSAEMETEKTGHLLASDMEEYSERRVDDWVAVDWVVVDWDVADWVAVIAERPVVWEDTNESSESTMEERSSWCCETAGLSWVLQKESVKCINVFQLWGITFIPSTRKLDIHRERDAIAYYQVDLFSCNF